MWISRRWRGRSRRWAPAASGRSSSRNFCAGLASNTRAAALKAKATREVADIDQALARLIGHDRTGMGELFKVAAFAHPSVGAPPGFAADALAARLRDYDRDGHLTVDGIDAAGRFARHASRASATLSSRAPAACRRASMRRSMAASAPTTRPTRSPRTAPAWRQRSASTPDRSAHPYQIHSPDVVVADDAVAARGPSARRRHCHARAAAGHRRIDRRLRAAAVRRRRGRRDRRRPCRLARRAHRRDRGDVAAMEKLGADRARITAALGPTIRQPNYEVGPEFVARFLAADAGNARFFTPSTRAGHAMFDLAGYIAERVCSAPASCNSKISACAPMPNPSGSSAIGARHAAASRIMAGISTRSRSPSDRTGTPCAAGLRSILAARLCPADGTRNQKPRPQGCLWSGVGAARATGAAWRVCTSWRLLGFGLRADIGRMQSPIARRVGRAAARRHCRLRVRSTARRPGNSTKLVRDLNDEAQGRRLAVISREQSAAYRVRGYLAAKVTKHRPRSPGCGMCSTETNSARCASAARRPRRSRPCATPGSRR